MRKVSLLCLLGLIATAPVMSVAGTKPNGETEVYSDAITMVVEELGANEQFDVTKFLEEIDKVITGGQTLTQKRVFDACFESYTSTKSGMDKVTEITNFCTDFDAKLVKAQAKVQKDMEDRIRQAKQFAAEGDAKPILYHSKGGANERYGVYKTKYGYAVYTTKTKNNGKLGVNDAKEFVCFLGDEGTENCNTNKSCVASSSVKSSKYGVVFVCGNSANNYASLKDGFSVYKNNRDGAVFSQYALMAQTGMDQLELIKNNAIKEVQGKEEQAAVVQELQECPTGTKRPSEAAAACLEGICKLNIQECYLNAQVDCYEAAARKEPANWTGKECNCGNLQDWDPYLAKCVVKQSKRQQLVANGASKERLACYDAGSETKWNGDNKSTDITNCTCVDTAKTWDGKSCVDIAAQQSQLARQKCVDFILSHPGEARLNDQTQSCDCLMQGSVVKVWNGERCEPDASNCNPVVEGATELPLDIDVKYIAKNSGKYLKYQNDAKVYNNSLKQLLAAKPELRKAGPCSEMYKRAELEKAFADIQDKDAAIGQMAGQTYNMEYTDGKYKRSASADEAFEDAKYNFAYLIMNGKVADPYDNIKTKSEANALARQAQGYLGSDIKCSGSCGAVGDDRVECVAGSIKMKFRYDTICSQKVKTVSKQGVDNRKPDEVVQEKKPVQTQQYDFQPSYLYKYQGYDKKDA